MAWHAVLFLPSLWFHHVVSLDKALSFSVWSEEPASQLLEQYMSQVPLPIQSKWGVLERGAALRVVLASVVAGLSLDMNLAQFVQWALLESRYRHIGTADYHGGRGLSPLCWNREAEDEVLAQGLSAARQPTSLALTPPQRSRSFKHTSRAPWSSSARSKRRWAPSAGTSSWQTSLSWPVRFFAHMLHGPSHAANTVVGTASVKQLLYDLVLC